MAQIAKSKWLADLSEMMQTTPLPCMLVACPENFLEGNGGPSWPRPPATAGTAGRQAPKRERIVSANRAWLDLMEYEESQIANKPFSGVPGLQGELTTEDSKLKMGCLLISKDRSVSSEKIVNYTGRSRAAIELDYSIRIFKQGGRNIFYLCSVQSSRRLGGGGGSGLGGARAPTASGGFRQHIQAAQQLAELNQQLHACRQPCMLIGRSDGGNPGGSRVLRETIVAANRQWYDLMEREESEVVDKAFAQIPGLQGPLTTESSKLILAGLLVREDSRTQHVSIVNYTGRTREPIELKLKISIIKRADGRNAFFFNTVEGFQRLRGGAASIPVSLPGVQTLPEEDWHPTAPASMQSPTQQVPQAPQEEEPIRSQGLDNEPEPEEQQCPVSYKGTQSEEMMVSTLRDLMQCTTLPSVLAKAGGERVMYGNDAWQALFPGALAFCRQLGELFTFESPQERGVVSFRPGELLHTEEKHFKDISASCKLDHRSHPLELTLAVDIYKSQKRGESLRFFVVTVIHHTARSAQDLEPPAEQRRFSRPAAFDTSEADPLNDDINADIMHSRRFSRQSNEPCPFEDNASVCSFETVSEPVEEPMFCSMYEEDVGDMEVEPDPALEMPASSAAAAAAAQPDASAAAAADLPQPRRSSEPSFLKACGAAAAELPPPRRSFSRQSSSSPCGLATVMDDDVLPEPGEEPNFDSSGGFSRQSTPFFEEGGSLSSKGILGRASLDSTSWNVANFDTGFSRETTAASDCHGHATGGKEMANFKSMSFADSSPGSGSTPGTPPPAEAVPAPFKMMHSGVEYNLEAEILELTNRFRREEGLEPIEA